MFKWKAMALCIAQSMPQAGSATTSDDALDTALSLSIMLNSARGVIGRHQALINDESLGKKGLSGESVLDEAVEAYTEATGEDPRELEETSLRGQLLRAQMNAIESVLEENLSLIDREGTGFKGFVPAVFARLVNERFAELTGGAASVKVTAPPDLVRNRKARPDDWERNAIAMHLAAPDWPLGDVFHSAVEIDGQSAYRVLVPEYYTEGCLACHGAPAGEIDITGYPMEGGALGDLGGVISITLFDAD